jgi:hypothetical protein
MWQLPQEHWAEHATQYYIQNTYNLWNKWLTTAEAITAQLVKEIQKELDHQEAEETVEEFMGVTYSNRKLNSLFW